MASIWLLGATACTVADGADAPAQASAGEGARATAAHVHAAPDHDHRRSTVPGAPSDLSLYNLEGSWTDQDGRARELSDLAGRVQVVAMVYTHCSYACPRIVAQMKRIEAEAAGWGLEERVGFVLVSIDPERDTPERLARFAESSRLDPGRWTLLNGSDDQVLELSVLLGVKYQATAEGEFAHSNVLTILDPAGVAAHRVEGLGAELDGGLETVRALAEETR